MAQIGEIETPLTIPESQLCVTNKWASTTYVFEISQLPRWPQTNLVGPNSGQNTAHGITRRADTHQRVPQNSAHGHPPPCTIWIPCHACPICPQVSFNDGVGLRPKHGPGSRFTFSECFIGLFRTLSPPCNAAPCMHTKEICSVVRVV